MSRKRLNKIRKVALFLEDLLHDRVHVGMTAPQPLLVTEFTIVEPEGLPIQKLYSNDCGVFVATWMVNHEHDHYNIHVDDATRLMIVLDLVMEQHNYLGDEILARAMEDAK